MYRSIYGNIKRRISAYTWSKVMEGVHTSRFHAPRCQEVPSSFSVEGNSPLCVLTNGSPFVYVLSPGETVSVWLYLCESMLV